MPLRSVLPITTTDSTHEGVGHFPLMGTGTCDVPHKIEKKTKKRDGTGEKRHVVVFG